MSTVLLQPAELRTRGFEVLVRELGWVNAVRFMQQFEASDLDYVKERQAIFANKSMEDISRDLAKYDRKPQS